MSNILGDFQVGGYIYHNPVSLSEDTIDDVRSYSSGGDIVKEKCTVANPVKGAGTWMVVPGGGGTDEKVKYDAGDSTAGYVADKIIAGDGISVAEGDVS